MNPDDFYVKAEPRANGEWLVQLYASGHSRLEVERRHGLSAIRLAWSERHAARVGRRLLRRHRKAAANLQRPSFTIKEAH